MKALHEVYLGFLADNFELYRTNVHSMGEYHELLHLRLQNDSPESFTMGAQISIHLLLEYLLTSPLIISTAIMTCSLDHTNPWGKTMLSDCFFRVMDEYHSFQAAADCGLECSLSSLCHLCEGPQI